MVGHMESLIFNAEQKLSREKTRLASEQQPHLAEPDIADDYPLEQDDENQSEEELNETINPGKEKAKQRKRARKKRRKK